MSYTAEIFRDGQLVAKLERARPYTAADAADWPGCVLVIDGVEYPGPEPLPELPTGGPTPRTQALRPEEIVAAREAIAQAEELARQSTQTKYRDALLLLTATFDGVLAKLGGEQ